MNGQKKTEFHEICKVSFQEAGTMITALRSLVKLCEELSTAYTEIENEAIAERFTKLSEDMRRGILFLPSLYYQNNVSIGAKPKLASEEDSEEDSDSDSDSGSGSDSGSDSNKDSDVKSEGKDQNE
mmetsp:Transcript_26803/g.23663  ORF Transcript_26803/g.23663 Transcript_26803/m.23663 type:complete len:126 (+) Transcript_26803:63-440(+)